jgi:hypothetical protein
MVFLDFYQAALVAQEGGDILAQRGLAARFLHGEVDGEAGCIRHCGRLGVRFHYFLGHPGPRRLKLSPLRQMGTFLATGVRFGTKIAAVSGS